MSNLKRFKVDDGALGDLSVTIEVDQDLLTVELASEINKFWGNHEHRLREVNGDVRMAAVRLFAVRAFSHILADGGSFGDNAVALSLYTSEVLCEEGWPEECGIRLIGADVCPPDFYSMTVQEVA